MRHLLLAILVCTAGAGEPPGLIAPHATVKVTGGGYRITAGPAVNADGGVYFSDSPNHRIMVWNPDGTISTWREDSGGAIGLRVHAGLVYACLGERRQVATFAADGQVNPLSYQGGGKRFNSPNDVWVAADGGVYFTDPRQGPQAGVDQDGEYVWYITPGVGEATRVAKDFTRPGGIVGTPDGKHLYVADHGGSLVWRYTITAPGHLADRMKFCGEGSAGMCLDTQGNLYLTWKNGIQIYSPAGTKLGTIPTPIEPTGLCFGGPQRTTLFITGGGRLHTLEMRAQGVE